MQKKRRRRVDTKSEAKALAEKLISVLRTTPVGATLVALIAFVGAESLPLSLYYAMPILSYLTLVSAMVMTASFSRSRAFFISLVLFVSLLGLTAFSPENMDKIFVRHAAYSIISLLLPLNLLFFGSVIERGILSPWGKRHLIIIFIQVVFFVGVIFSEDKEIISGINKEFLTLPSSIPDAAIIAFLVTAFLLIAKRRRANAQFKLAVFSVAVAVAFGHHFQSVPIAVPLFYTAAGLTLILYVIQDHYSLAYLDELTGLPSRRSLNEALLKLGGPYVIAMLDVDHFKKFNDNYGHDAGDDVLRLMAHLMKEIRLKGGKPFRYGGEEFTILFPNRCLSDTLADLEELREKIARRKFVLRSDGKGKNESSKKISITVSIGVAEQSNKLTTPEEVIKEADTALYRAKEKGRNCVSK